MFKILLVDDNPIVLDAVGLALRRKGFEIDMARSAEEAVERLATNDYDAVVTDYRMPGNDGAWLLRHVREHAPGTFRLLISAEANLDGASLEDDGTAHRFFGKPVDLRELVAALQTAREQHRQRAV